MSESKLKPCPFCGDKNPFIEPKSKSLTYRVYCDNCTAQSAWRFSKKGAIAAWNRRAK